MKVFISWSGALSHKVAVHLKDWLQMVIQSLDPYVSSEDIEKGSRWSVDIGKELEVSSFGIICVTPQNLTAPWINFEAGSLSRSFDKSKVSPFLFGLLPSDLGSSPLLQFQSTLYQEEDVLKLLKSINNALDDRKLDDTKLRTTFNRWWDDLKKSLDALLPESQVPANNSPAKSEETSIRNAVEEILKLTREQNKLLLHQETAGLSYRALANAMFRINKYAFYSGKNEEVIDMICELEKTLYDVHSRIEHEPVVHTSEIVDKVALSIQIVEAIGGTIEGIGNSLIRFKHPNQHPLFDETKDKE